MSHSQKVLSKMAKKNQSHQSAASEPKDLKKQYDVIRDDLMKLKEDLQKGYSMARGMMDKKTLLNQLLKSK